MRHTPGRRRRYASIFIAYYFQALQGHSVLSAEEALYKRKYLFHKSLNPLLQRKGSRGSSLSQASSDIAITGVQLLSAAYPIVQLPAVPFGGDGVH